MVLRPMPEHFRQSMDLGLELRTSHCGPHHVLAVLLRSSTGLDEVLGPPAARRAHLDEVLGLLRSDAERFGDAHGDSPWTVRASPAWSLAYGRAEALAWRTGEEPPDDADVLASLFLDDRVGDLLTSWGVEAAAVRRGLS